MGKTSIVGKPNSIVILFGLLCIVLLLLSPASVLAGKAIELRYTTVSPTTHPNYGCDTRFADAVNKKTNGRVHITIFPGGTLNPPFETYNAVKVGIADIGGAPVGFSSAVMPLNMLFGNALYGLKSSSQAARIFSQALKNLPALQEEFAGIHLLWVTATLPLSINTQGKKIEKPDDFKGMVVRFPPGLEPLAKAWGATPITMPTVDIYVSLQKGIVKGYFGGAEMLKAMRLAEHVNYSTSLSSVFGLSWGGMNIKKWNSLPDDIKKIISDLTPRTQRDHIQKTDESAIESMQFAITEGVEFYKLNQDQINPFYTISKKVFQDVANELEKRGKPANEVLQEMERLLAEE